MANAFEDIVGELIFHNGHLVSNRHTLTFFNPLRLPAAATSPVPQGRFAEFGGGREGVAWMIAFKDEFANTTFEVTDPRGYKVICADDRLNNHIHLHHPEMVGQEEAIQEPTLGID